MSLPGRFFGVFLSPVGTLRRLAGQPVWLDTLVVILAAGAAFSYFSFPYVQQGKLLTFEDNAAAFIAAHGADQYAAAVERIKGESRALRAFVVCPLTMLTGFLFSSLIALAAGRAVFHRGHYLQVFSCFLHAGLVDNILGQAVRLGLVLVRRSTLGVSTGLPVFFPGLAAGSTVHTALSQVDLFSLWMYGLFGLGLASTFKISVRKGSLISFSLWILRGLAAVAFSVLEKKLFF